MNFLPILALLPFGLFGSAPEMPVPTIQTPLQGIYMTSSTVGGKHGDALADEFAQLGGNMVVFDIQDASGRIAYPSNIPLSIQMDNRGKGIKDLPATVQKLREKGFYTVARFVLFKNGFLANKKPQWTIKRKGTQSPFVSRDGPIWLDPGNGELRDYYLDICRELALSGVDEIQFDYVRFPEGGKGGYAGYSYTGEDVFTHAQAISDFVSFAAQEIHYLGPRVGVDVFGIVVWDNVSWKVIGQDIADLGRYVDAIYPMPYPSHFGPGWGGHKNPADEPYFFVQETTKKFLEQTAETGVAIRPWLQGFAMRASHFGPNYVKDQIRALSDIGIYEFTSWNARNDYWATFGALK